MSIRRFLLHTPDMTIEGLQGEDGRMYLQNHRKYRSEEELLTEYQREATIHAQDSAMVYVIWIDEGVSV